MFDEHEKRALTLSTLAGLTTSVGGMLAVTKKPDARALAALLGVAIGVMTSLSLIELYLKAAIERGFVTITAATLLGAGTYACIAPLLPNPEVGVVQPNERTRTLNSSAKVLTRRNRMGWED